MGRDRGVVCVGSVADYARVFIIVFSFRLLFFFPSWSDTPLPPPPSWCQHTPRLPHRALWLCYMRDTDRWGHSEEASLVWNLLIVCNHPYLNFTSHPKSILDQFHGRERSHPSKIESIFNLIFWALPVVIKLLGGINERLYSAAAVCQYFFSLQT